MDPISVLVILLSLVLVVYAAHLIVQATSGKVDGSNNYKRQIDLINQAGAQARQAMDEISKRYLDQLSQEYMQHLQDQPKAQPTRQQEPIKRTKRRMN